MDFSWRLRRREVGSQTAHCPSRLLLLPRRGCRTEPDISGLTAWPYKRKRDEGVGEAGRTPSSRAASCWTGPCPRLQHPAIRRTLSANKALHASRDERARPVDDRCQRTRGQRAAHLGRPGIHCCSRTLLSCPYCVLHGQHRRTSGEGGDEPVVGATAGTLASTGVAVELGVSLGVSLAIAVSSTATSTTASASEW